MSCINQVVLLGRLVKDPEFAETASKRRYAKLAVETEKYVKSDGGSRRLAVTHSVLCFNQFSLGPLERGRKGSWVKVIGELGASRDGRAEVTVSQYSGEVGLMGFPSGGEAEAPAPAAQQEAPRPAGQTRAVPGGGLGRLPSGPKRPQEDSSAGAQEAFAERKAPAAPTRPGYDPLDDQIPF